MALTYLSGERIQGLAPAPTSTHSQNSGGGLTGVDLYQTTGGGGWGIKITSSHTLVGKKIASITFTMRIVNIQNASHQTITLKHFGSTPATVRATGSTMNSANVATSLTAYTFTFANPVTVVADDFIMLTAPNDIGTAGGWNCEINESGEETGTYVSTWIDNSSSFTVQTGQSRKMKYSAVYETADGDVKPTDVPEGTRYEETNTRKIYRWKDTGYGSVATGTGGNFDTATNVTVNSSVSTPSGLGDSTILAGSGGFTKLAWSASGTTVIPHHADFTMAYWLYPTDVDAGSPSTNQSWIQPSSGSAPIRVEQMWTGGANKVSFIVTDDDGDNAGSNYTFTPSEDTWHLFIGDFDASTGQTTYYCGKVGTDSTPQSIGSDTDSGCKGAGSSTELRTIAGNDSEYFKGRWGEFCIWNKVLSSSERNALYNSGNGALANTVAKTNITVYFDGSSATGVNLALPSDWVEKGTA